MSEIVKLVPRIFLGIVCLIFSRAAFEVFHLCGWYPELQLADIVMVSPQTSIWGVSTVAAIGIWMGLDYLFYRRRQPLKTDQPIAASIIRGALTYLNERDSLLGPAIISMARQSAWGRWYSAQHLVNSGSRIGLLHLYQMAAGIVMEEITNGNLEVRGRRSDQARLEYESIDRTHWRSSGLLFVSDPRTLWKMKVIPRGVAELSRDGNVIRTDNPTAAHRTSLLDYDSLIVDAYQFEKLWPDREKVADKKRRKLLWQARWRGLDRDEIRRLC